MKNTKEELTKLKQEIFWLNKKVEETERKLKLAEGVILSSLTNYSLCDTSIQLDEVFIPGIDPNILFRDVDLEKDEESKNRYDYYKKEKDMWDYLNALCIENSEKDSHEPEKDW